MACQFQRVLSLASGVLTLCSDCGLTRDEVLAKPDVPEACREAAGGGARTQEGGWDRRERGGATRGGGLAG
jgi:hypothetical protein